MKKETKTEDQKKKTGYRTPSDFRRALRYKNRKLKTNKPSFQMKKSPMQTRGKGFRG
jgi:hypothetical protein